MSINVSALQLRSPQFVDQVGESLDRHQLDPGRVVLEITEEMLVEEIDSGTDNLAALRELGVRIAIDDFGTGYCSLSYLQKFPVDIIKIDRQFIDELDEQPRNDSLAKMILQTHRRPRSDHGRRRDRTALAAAHLRQFGCDVGQGYLLSGPLEAAELERRFGVSPFVSNA